jgi:hypothetical protein
MKQSVESSLPVLIELFRSNDAVVSTQIAEILGDFQGADSVTRCRAYGLDVRAVGFVPGSRQRRRYRLENIAVWETFLRANL